MIRGQKRALKREVPHVHKDMKCNIHNRFDIEVVDAQTGKVKQKAYAENIVLNALWTRLLAPNTYFNFIHYGTGTGTLVSSRTSLFTFLGVKAAGSKVLTYDWANGWISSRKSCQITETENVGSELREVGIGHGSSSGNLVTHALLKDMNGNVISVVKTSTDIINIYATVFIYWNVNGYNGIKIAPYRNNKLITEFLCGDYDSTRLASIQFFYGSPAATGLNTDAQFTRLSYIGIKLVTLTYSSASKKISLPTVRLGAAELNNANAIKGIALSSTNVWNVNGAVVHWPVLIFDVPAAFFEKSTFTGQAIGTGNGTTTAFKTAFGFVKPGFKIYVNGVEQTSGVTVDTGVPLINNQMGAFFELLETDANTVGTTQGQMAPCFDMISGNVQGNFYAIFNNPLYSYGIDTLYCGYGVKVEVSDDRVIWTTVAHNNVGTVTVTAGNKTKMYWKVSSSTTSATCHALTSNSIKSTNINFSTAPASGAVITADYDCEVIAKDVNHVFDFSFEITLAEKTS